MLTLMAADHNAIQNGTMKGSGIDVEAKMMGHEAVVGARTGVIVTVIEVEGVMHLLGPLEKSGMNHAKRPAVESALVKIIDGGVIVMVAQMRRKNMKDVSALRHRTADNLLHHHLRRRRRLPLGQTRNDAGVVAGESHETAIATGTVIALRANGTMLARAAVEADLIASVDAQETMADLMMGATAAVDAVQAAKTSALDEGLDLLKAYDAFSLFSFVISFHLVFLVISHKHCQRC